MNKQHNNWTEHIILYEEFDDVEEVTTIFQSTDKQHIGQKKNDKQHNGQKKKDKQRSTYHYTKNPQKID